MDQSLPLARRAAAEGLAAFALVFAGAHINPAVTVAFAVNRHFPTEEGERGGARAVRLPA